jgi:hypothetical protein
VGEEGGEKGEGVGMGEGEGGAGTSEPEGVGSIDGHRASSYACEVLTGVSSEITFDSSAEMVLCAATSSTADLS